MIQARRLKHSSTGVAAGACALLLFGVYLYTMAPALTWAHYGGDGGDLVRAVARASWPHPPGFPTYLLAGSVAMSVPFGTPAWRLNALSGLSAALACGILVCALAPLLSRQMDELDPNRHVSVHLLGVVAGCCLGLAPLFWSQAVITEVYAPATLVSAGVLLLVLGGAPAWLLGTVWGAGLGVHFSLFALAPLIGWRMWQHRDTRWRDTIAVLATTTIALVGIYLLTFVTRQAPSPWIDTGEPASVRAFLRADIYRGYVLALPPAEWPRRLLSMLSLLARQFTPIGAALAVAGIVGLWSRQRELTVALLLSFGLFGIYALGYNTADSLVYLVPALPLAAVWLALGMMRTAVWLRSRLSGRHAVALLAVVPLLQLLLFWGSIDIHDDNTAIAWGERILTQAPAGAVLLTERDDHTFTLWYMHDVLHKRPDIIVIDADLWAYSPYQNIVSRQVADMGTDPNQTVEDVAAALNRPLVRVPAD